MTGLFLTLFFSFSKFLFQVCAIPPQSLNDQIIKSARSLVLENPHCENAGVKVDIKNPIKTTGSILPPPVFIYNKNQVNHFDHSKFNWRPGNIYVLPAEIRCWAIYAFESKPMFDQANLVEYARQFVGMCKSRGMSVSNPAEISLEKYSKNIEKLDELFAYAASGGCQYLMFVTTKGENFSHSKLYL